MESSPRMSSESRMEAHEKSFGFYFVALFIGVGGTSSTFGAIVIEISDTSIADYFPHSALSNSHFSALVL